MNKKIAFIISTFLRDSLLYKSIQSLVENLHNNFEIIIVDQNPTEAKLYEYSNNHIYYYGIPYNSGLSYARNFGVQIANELECDYVVIGSDSFLFNESIQNINKIVDFLENLEYSFCGFELINSTCGWEAKLNLIEGQSFELDFIDKTKKDFQFHTPAVLSKKWTNEDGSPTLIGDIVPYWEVDICRNFFIAKIDMLLNVQWDENLLLGEHEDFFWQVQQLGYKGIWTNYIDATKMTDRPTEYSELRKQNFKEGIKKLKEKYNISNWVTYKNLERAK